MHCALIQLKTLLQFHSLDSFLSFQMATSSKFDLAAALKRSVVKKEERFIRAADVVLHCKWKKKKPAHQQMVIPKKMKPKMNATSPSRCEGKTKQQQRPTILEMLTDGTQRAHQLDKAESRDEHCEKVNDEMEYVKSVLQKVCRTSFHGDPWIRKPYPISAACALSKQHHDAGHTPLDAKDLWNLCARPDIFLWDPNVIDPAVEILCPRCGARAVRSNWNHPKELHVLGSHAIYVARRYECYSCPNSKQSQAGGKRVRCSFTSDDLSVLKALPTFVRKRWPFLDTGRHLYDPSLVDLVRAMATKCSWSAIGTAIAEMQDRWWHREVQEVYRMLCETKCPTAVRETTSCPKKLHVSCPMVRKIYMLDFKAREAGIDENFKAELGDDILRIDWTNGAAMRCRERHLLNIMDGRSRILTFRFTCNAKPEASKPCMQELFDRGVRPRVVYVDDECCGCWLQVLRTFWPDVVVKLDPMHAMKRLTETTASTQHPDHGSFCATLANCIFKYDTKVMERLSCAWFTEHGDNTLPTQVKRKYVPRIIPEPQLIVNAIEKLLEEFQTRDHKTESMLLTARTEKAWQLLRQHILKGCLSDPLGIDLNFDGSAVMIGGIRFASIKSLRGTSPVEGLHAHQKQWLGIFGQHDCEVGAALLKDGAWRWNRAKSKAREQFGEDGDVIDRLNFSNCSAAASNLV